MKFKFIISSTLLLCASTLWAAEAPSKFSNYQIPEGISKILDSSSSSMLKNANIGIIIQSMQDGKILYEKNADHLYSPASTLKLFTAIAALDFLKPNFVYRTQLFTSGVIKDRVLQGDIYLKFSGDPLLKVSDLKNLMQQIKHRGIDKITGHVYLDDSAYNEIPYPPGCIWDDLSYSYAAPMSAIILNENKFALHFDPVAVGQKPRIWSDLPTNVVIIDNHAITTSGNKDYCPLTIYSDMENHYTIRGCLDKRWGIQHRTMALRKITPYAAALVINILQGDQVAVSNNVFIKQTPSNATLFATYESDPLYKIIHKMLKESNNIATNSVFKKMGGAFFNTIGTWQNGLLAMKRILKPTGIDFSKNLLADGAGLSRYNLVSARNFSQLLWYAYHNNTVHDPLINALPVAGKDGTLIGRMLAMGKGGRIHAKTGTMTGVTSLAGYVYTKNNGAVSFVIMVNGFVKPRSPYVKLQDEICKFLVEARPSYTNTKIVVKKKQQVAANG